MAGSRHGKAALAQSPVIPLKLTGLVASVVGSKSTGAFAGASGPGAVQVAFAATAPRFKTGPSKGKCNPNGQQSPKGAVASFLGSLVLTAR